jgi:uncharacterized protein with HEPN domain
MKKREDVVYLKDILDAIRRIESYMRGTNEKKFDRDLMRQDAVVRQVRILGEASRQISIQFKEQHPEIPWAEMIGMRNRIVHDYRDVDIATVWDTVRNDLPPLKQAVAKLVKQVKG